MKTTNLQEAKRCLFAVLLLTLGLIPIEGHAISNCAIGLKQSTTLPTIDGVDGGAEWTDSATSILDSNVVSSCLDPLKDYLEVTDTYPDRNVTIRSKRYQRSGVWYLGFIFVVRDLTDTGSCGIGTLCVGETIVMQFNPIINGDDELAVGEDKRFVLNHKWQSTGPDPDVIDVVTLNVEPAINDALCAATANKQFSADASSGINYQFRKGIAGGGYIAEIEVPVTFFEISGALTEDIGISIAVINEFGKDSFAGDPDYDCTSPTGTCEAAGSSFPNSLPIINYENPVDAICELGWTIPSQWGVGYLVDPPGDYSISRLPYYTNSDAISVFECDNPGYTYYPDQPCRARIQAEIENTGAVVSKKVAIIWAKHGTGDPAEYNFVDLKDVVLASGTVPTPISTTISSDLWDSVPVGEPNHPCLRVYIFPDTISPADEDILRGVSSGGVITRTQLNNLVADNSVQTNHWAQKNISRHSTTASCPDEGCRIVTNNIFNDVEFQLISSANAQTPADVAVINNGNNQNGNESSFVTGDLTQFAKNNVMVQVKTVAYKLLPEGATPKYSLIEDFGGIVQVYPLSMVQENPRLPLEFLVSNFSDETRRIKLFADLYKPDGAADLDIEVEGVSEKIITLQPGTEVTVKATLNNLNLGGSSCGPWPAFICELTILQILIALIILIILIILMFKMRSSS